MSVIAFLSEIICKKTNHGKNLLSLDLKSRKSRNPSWYARMKVFENDFKR